MLLLLGTAGAVALVNAAGAQAANAQYSLNLTGIATGTAYTVSVQVGSTDDSGSGRNSVSATLDRNDGRYPNETHTLHRTPSG